MGRKRQYSMDPETWNGEYAPKRQKPQSDNTTEHFTGTSGPTVSENLRTTSAFEVAKQPEQTQPIAAAPTEPTQQQRFEDALVDAYNLRGAGGLWDCALRAYIPAGDMRALHFVPPSFNDESMHMTLGADCAGEQYSPQNGLAVHRHVKEALEAGALVIVPNMPNHPTPLEVSMWKATAQHAYKFRVLTAKMAEHAQQRDRWLGLTSLDHRPLTFANGFRPRARYVHLMFHITMLRRVSGLTGDGWLMAELLMGYKGRFDKQYWGLMDVNLVEELEDDGADDARFWRTVPDFDTDEGYMSNGG